MRSASSRSSSRAPGAFSFSERSGFDFEIVAEIGAAFAGEIEQGGKARADGIDYMCEERVVAVGLQAASFESSFHERRKRFYRHGAQVLRIEPQGFGIDRVGIAEIDDRVAAIDAVEVEGVLQFQERHLFAIVFGRPSEEAEKVDIGAGEEAVVAIGGDADDGSVFALGELRAVGRNKQRKMGKTRQRRAGALKNQDVFEGVR